LRRLLALLWFLGSLAVAHAACAPVPFIFSFKQVPISSSQVNTNFQAVVNCVNALPAANQLVAFRNRLINGAMAIDQRNGGAAQNAITSGGVYTVDRFIYLSNQAGKFNAQQNLNNLSPLPIGDNYYEGLSSTAATAVANGDYYEFGQKIEAININDLQWGTSAAQTVTLSFTVQSSIPGVFAAAVQAASGYSYVAVYSVSIFEVNTWKPISITVPGTVLGTGGINVFFSLGCGATYRTAPNVWTAGTFYCDTTATNLVSTSGANFYITDVQFEPGPSATPFENRLYPIEFELAQRYHQIITSWQAANYTVAGGTVVVQSITPNIPMRALPTVTANSFVGSNCSGIGGNPVSASSIQMTLTGCTASSAINGIANVILDSEL
jgi:hypothetical protein